MRLVPFPWAILGNACYLLEFSVQNVGRAVWCFFFLLTARINYVRTGKGQRLV